MTVKAFKLITGEELICTTDDMVTLDGGGYINVKNAAVVILRDDERGQMHLGLLPYAPYAESVMLYNRGIVAELMINIKLENEYNRMFGSGIQIATADQIKA